MFLREGKKIDTDETLNNLVGFLEACRDRMTDLLEAGAHGLLTEQFYDKTLKVNDALTRTLEAELTGSSIASDDDLASYSPSFSIEVCIDYSFVVLLL